MGVGERVRNHTKYKANRAKEKLYVNLCKRIYGVLWATSKNSISLKLLNIKKKKTQEVYIKFHKAVCENGLRATGRLLST